MPTSPFAARYAVANAPAQLAADQGALLDVTIENSGATSWPHRAPNPITLSYRWHDSLGRVVIAEGQHIALPHTVAPGERAKLFLPVEPPARPGEYTLLIDLVQEGVAWLSDQGASSHTLPIVIVPAMSVSRRVTIVCNDSRINDAIGNYLRDQLRVFAARGDRVLALVEHLDERQPPAAREQMFRITLDALEHGGDDPLTRRALEHFRSSDLFIFNYPTYYRLVEAIRLVQSGQVMFDYHGVTPPELWGEGRGLEDLRQGQRNTTLARYADHIVTHSTYGRDELLAASGISPERVAMFPYAVSLDEFRPGPRDPELVARYGLEDRPVLLYVGRMAASKRIIDLVRALPLISARHPGTTLLLVGDTRTPPYPTIVAEAQAEAQALGCEKQVIFTGQVDDLCAHYNLCDIFVTASLHEGFCIPVIEAMACGKPVVGAHATALPETIGTGGLTFPPGDVKALAEAVSTLLYSNG